MVRIHRALTPAEWRRAAALAAAVLGLNVAGWGTLALFVAPQYPKALGIGVGVLAFMLGLRHAFDADHIAAIDNTTRKFLSDGRRSLAVGFFFSLGHSTIVFALGIGVAVAARATIGAVSHGSPLRSVGGLIGTLVSGGFLYLIAAMNLVMPVLFAAGMSLMDTLDGAFMAFAYDWAFAKPIRKIYYNIIITGLSVAVAFFVGTVELLQLLQAHLDLTGPFWSVVGAFDI